MKSPAFSFYSSDFLTGTMFMNNEQVGAYIRLMCMQHQTGHLSKDDIDQITDDPKVLKKFIKDDNNLYYNKRLDFEINKKNAYCESRANNRRKKDNISNSYEKDMKNICNSYDEHMENEKEKENINNNIFNYITNNILVINTLDYEKVQTLINEFTEEEIKEAVDKSKGKNVKYLEKVLRNPIQTKKETKAPEWLNKDIKSEELEDAELDELEEMFKEIDTTR